MPNHRVTEDWLGESVETLEDLLQVGLRAVCVGINPSLVSVEVGHYYQGRAGQRFLRRVEAAGLIPRTQGGYEDDAAFAAGVGFTDVVKRPTKSAKELRVGDYRYGRERLLVKIHRHRPGLVVFTYKKAAQVVFGDFEGHGFVPGLRLAATEVFVMPGPYEAVERRQTSLEALAAWVGESDAR